MSTDLPENDPRDLTDDEVAPETLTPVVRPGDLDALEAAALAGASQWTALATWARRDGQDPRSTDALKQLATHAGDPVAFTWMWSLITDRPARANWQTTAAMPAQVAVPEFLLADVAAELAASPSGEAARDTAREAIMARQHPTTPGALQLATAVLGAETAVVPEVGEEAARVLGESTDHEGRAALLAAAQSSPWPRRAQMLTCLREPLDEGEVAAILAALDEGRRHLSANVGTSDPHWSRVQRLVATLPAPQRLDVLAQDWLTQPGYATLLVAGPVMRALGAGDAAQIGHLLESAAAGDLSEPMVDALLAQLHTLHEPHAVDLAERAHRLLPPERTAAARQHYTKWVETYRESFLSGQERRRSPVLAALARMALAQPPSPTGLTELAALEQDEALHDYAEALRPGETSQLEVANMTGGQPRRLGAVLGLRLRGDLPHQIEQNRHQGNAPSPIDAATVDTIAILHALSGDQTSSGRGDAHSAEMLTGLVTVAAGLVTDGLVAAALDAGPASTTVIARAAPSPTAAILDEEPFRWPFVRTLDVLEAVASDAAVRTVEELAGALDWDVVESSGNLERAASALARHRRLLATAVRTAVNSQNGPPAQAASLARIVALVRALVDRGGEAHTEPDGDTGHQEMQDVAALITVLVEEPHDELHEVAGSWLAAVTPTRALADLVIRADDAITDPSPYLPARTAMASRFCAQAQDKARENDARIEALRAAQDLDAGQARASALDLIETSPAPLRLAAAEVIAITPPGPDDGDRLTALIATQRDRATRELLERARRRLASSSLDEALANAIDLVGAQGSFGDLDPDICLPHDKEAWERVFCQRVDQARASTSDTPESRANALILLADFLAEQAIATHWMTADKGGPGSRAEKILTRARDKPQSGNLAMEQQLLRELPLVRSWAGMRELRTGHHAPLDGTVPVPVTEQDAQAALAALRRVLEGWVQVMYAFAHQSPPAAAAR